MKINNQIKIGIMVTAVLAILIALTVKSGDFQFSKEGYTVKVHFTQIDGVDLNAPVMLNGFEVGHVEDIQINESGDEIKLELIVFIEASAKLREGAQAYVKNMGFLGEKYVGLTAGNKSGKVLTEGAVIIGEEPADMDKLLLDGKDIAKQIKEITTNLNERLKKNAEKIDNIIANVESITENIDERLAVNKENIDDTLTNLRSTSINLDQFSYDLKMNPWKLMYKTKEKKQKSIDLMNNE